MNNIKTCIITGCAGFIGSHLTEKCLKMGWYVWGIDKLSYCSYPKLMDEFQKKYPNQFKFEHKDINDVKYIPDIDILFNICAESHVDNSIANSNEFVKSNVNGVHNLLELVKQKKYNRPLFYQMSTDECYGDIESGSHTETSILSPSNPYSATKASADMLVMAYARTHNIFYKIGRATNTWGIRQHSEKLIPRVCKDIILEKPIPLHNFGTPKRTWLHVDDCVDGILTIVNHGKNNNIYNISGNFEIENWRITAKILNLFGKSPGKKEKMVKTTTIGSSISEGSCEIIAEFPHSEVSANDYEGKFALKYINKYEKDTFKFNHTIYTNLGKYNDTMTYCDFGYIRQGQDVRYSLDDSKLKKCGWKPIKIFDEELLPVVEYYKSNFVW